MTGQAPTLILPDAGPLITLAYAEALDLLLKPGWPVWIVDMVLHEVTRNATSTSRAIAAWLDRSGAVTRATRTFAHYQQRLLTASHPPRKAGLGELAIQETMNELETAPRSVFGILTPVLVVHGSAFASSAVRQSARRLPRHHPAP